MTLLPALTLASLIAWLGLALYWRHGAIVRLPVAPGEDAARPDWPSVTILIPARNEAASIWPVIRSHLESDYPGACEIVLVDDHSDDGTADLARAAAGDDARLTIIRPDTLPEGWSGKVWAQEAGWRHIQPGGDGQPVPDFILLTDADIVHAPGTLSALVDTALRNNTSLVSLMATLDRRGVWGTLLIPAFVYFFAKLYPFKRVNQPALRLAGAAGGCMLVRRERLSAIGGFDAIKSRLIDDCALADMLKNTDPRAPIYLAHAGPLARSLRDNRALGEIWMMVARTAYTQLNRNPFMLAGAIVGMVFLYALPVAALLGWPWHGEGLTALAGGLAWVMMALTYAPICRHYGLNPLHAFCLPAAAMVYTAMTLDSARRHWMGTGGRWKGRTYS